MIANAERKFTSFSLPLTIAGFTLLIWKKARFVEEVLFYPKNEVVAFPEIEIKWK